MKIDTREDFPELLDHLGLPRIVCEVGTAEGIFSTEMYGWGLEKLYLIDIWENVPFIDGCASFEQEWHNKNYKQVKELFGDKPNVVLLKGFSYKMAEHIPDESLGLCYIDADHTYHGAKADARVFWKKLVEGGIMAFHDFENYNYGVNRAVQEFASENGLEINVLKEDGSPDNVGAYIIKKVKEDGV